MSDMAYAVHTRSCTYLLDDDGICRWTLAPTGVPVPGADRYLGAQFVACLDVREIGGLVGELRIGAAGLFARSENGRLVLLRTPAIEHVEHRPDAADFVEPEASLPAIPAPRVAAPSLPAYTPYVEPLPVYVPRATAAPPAYSTPAYAPPAPPVQATPQHLPPPAAPVYVAPAYRAPEQTATEYLAPDYSAPVYAQSTYTAAEYAAPDDDAPSTHTQPLPLAPPRTLPPPPGPYALPYALEPEIAPEDEYLSELDVEELVTFSEVTLTIPLYRPETQTVPSAPRRGVIGPGRRLR
ncbi:MAG: hypothetical protein ABJE95_08970 [Byssovorax sp.]